MSQIEHKDFKIDLQLKSIELLKSNINIPTKIDVSLNTFNFNINLEVKADTQSKTLFIIVSVDIKSEDQVHILGSLSASCIYSVSEFEKTIKIDPDGKINMPQGLTDILNSISVSTVRGIMFSTFKGTFLHNAFLPIIDPNAFQQVSESKLL